MKWMSPCPSLVCMSWWPRRNVGCARRFSHRPVPQQQHQQLGPLKTSTTKKGNVQVLSWPIMTYSALCISTLNKYILNIIFLYCLFRGTDFPFQMFPFQNLINSGFFRFPFCIPLMCFPLLSLSNRWLEKWNKINVLQNKACQKIFLHFQFVSVYVGYTTKFLMNTKIK